MTKSLPSTEGQQLRETVKSCLDEYGNRPPIPTLNQVECAAITVLKENKEIVILPADKDNATVELNKNQYTSKMKELLDQDDYKIIKRNPTNKLVSTIKKTLENILQSNNITPELASYEDAIYEQTDGTAMGSSLSPTVANIFMEDFENTAIATFHLQSKIWKRYVDDTFVIWPHNNSSLQEFLSHINGLHDRIKFTMEIENNNSIAFLDVLVTKNNSRLTTTAYRKPTHTDRYLIQPPSTYQIRYYQMPQEQGPQCLLRGKLPL